jgi:hypothetical protein
MPDANEEVSLHPGTQKERLKIIGASGSQRLMISLFFKAAINEFV